MSYSVGCSTRISLIVSTRKTNISSGLGKLATILDLNFRGSYKRTDFFNSNRTYTIAQAAKLAKVKNNIILGYAQKLKLNAPDREYRLTVHQIIKLRAIQNLQIEKVKDFLKAVEDGDLIERQIKFFVEYE